MEEKIPLFETIAQKIIQGIKSGQFQEVLPAEQELSQLYSVSRSTIRSALQKLSGDFIIKTVHGKGSYITNQSHNIPLRVDRLKGFYQLLCDTGQEVTLTELGVTHVDSFKSEYPLPAIFYTNPVVIVKRLLSSNGRPQIYIEEYFSFADLLTLPFGELPDSIYDLVYEYTGQRIKYTVTRFHPILPTKEAARIFAIKQNTPILLTTEQHYNMLNSYMFFSKIFLNSTSDMQIGLIRTK